MKAIDVEDWGQIEYSLALAKQLKYLEKISKDGMDEKLIFCTHPPVVTVGRRTKEGDIFSWQGAVVKVQRGGRATYHGPSQIISYPILDLKKRHHNVSGYVRVLELAIIDTLLAFEIHSEARSGAENTGVWVGKKKIASIGIAVKGWTTYHGLAINFSFDSKAFQGINPCGFSAEVMTDVQSEVNGKILRTEFQDRLVSQLQFHISTLK